MKVLYSWLKDYLECDLTPQQVADAMTSIGIEVDGVEEQEEIPGGLAGVVVAKVLECVPHPDSDHLHITKVDDGSPEPVGVVCGAPNVAAGQKVLFARIGTVLPGDFKIKKSKIRGVESFGMICAEDELGIGTSHDGIMVLPDDAVIGTPAKEYLGLKTEAAIEYEITANRVDAASHFGVARDLYAYLVAHDIPCKLHYPDAPETLEGEGEAIPVEVIDTEGAPRYSGITLRGVKVGPSPEWLQKKLLGIGHNPINNVVDISNFILFELGQPLHTFDADKIGGGKVIVRKAAEGETEALIAVVGIKPGTLMIGEQMQTEDQDPEQVEFLAGILDQIEGRGLTAHVEKIDFSNPRSPEFSYDNRFTVVLGSNHQLEYKFGMFVSVLEKLKAGDVGVSNVSDGSTAHFSPN